MTPESAKNGISGVWNLTGHDFLDDLAEIINSIWLGNHFCPA
jgi:hypothetical protein